MRRRTEGEQNLYRLTLQRSGSLPCSETINVEQSLELVLLSLEALLAPLSVKVMRCDRLSGPRCSAGSDGETRIAVVDLRIPIDLPAIDYAVRAAGLAVVDLESVGPESAGLESGDGFEVAVEAGPAGNRNPFDGRRPAGV